MEELVVGSPPMRKRRNDCDYSRNKIKQARIKGQAYVNHRRNTIAEKYPGFHCR